MATSLGLIALAIATPVVGQKSSYYVLDGFGGVHAGGGAPSISGTPYFGFDIAKDIAYVAAGNGNGVLVLDGFGGVHQAGLGPVAPSTPYFGFNIARAIAYRNVPPRVAGGSGNLPVNLGTSSLAFTVIQTIAISAPDDGFLLVAGSAFMACAVNPTDDLAAQLSMNVDATTGAGALGELGSATWQDCLTVSGFVQAESQTLTHLFPVSAGAHTLHLLARKAAGTGVLSVTNRSLTAVFIDHDGLGNS
jgi:hypothetical protein